ncbi:MAG TPA: alpha/beta hydrolase, partial [Burkholderiales bacterium]|nr:alpha/beta hydrolase [Burkholderiales bacterium]
RTLQRGLDVLIDTDLRAVLREIGTEALVIHGERDALVPLAAAEYLASRLPRGRLAIVPGAAHAPFVSDAQTVADLMVEFFDG